MGPAHFGLCTAWANVMNSNGKAGERSPAFLGIQTVSCGDVWGTADEESGEEAPATEEQLLEEGSRGLGRRQRRRGVR